MTIEEMRKRKIELGYNYEMIAKLSGLPISTVQKILGGVTKAPRRQSLLALEKALTAEPIDPVNTGKLATPVAQAEPGNPANTESPITPAVPAEAGNPANTEPPTTPAVPTEPANPVKAVNLTSQANSANSIDAGNPGMRTASYAASEQPIHPDMVRESAAVYHAVPYQGIHKLEIQENHSSPYGRQTDLEYADHLVRETAEDEDKGAENFFGTKWEGKAQGADSTGVNRPLSTAARQEIAYMRRRTRDLRQGTYTAADRETFPDERRTELIDGVIYDMASPSWKHQTIVSKLYQLFQSQIEKEGCRCLCFLAPFDVALDGDPWTRVQPDFMVLCHTVTGGANYMNGAPDLIVEVLSPSTRRKDQKVKSRKYAEAGVREYWMVDPDRQTITILYMNDPAPAAGRAPATSPTPAAGSDHNPAGGDDHNSRETIPENADGQPYAAIYGFHDKIPVGICQDGFEVDFSAIADVLQRTQDWGLIQPADQQPTAPVSGNP